MDGLLVQMLHRSTAGSGFWVGHSNCAHHGMAACRAARSAAMLVRSSIGGGASGAGGGLWCGACGGGGLW